MCQHRPYGIYIDYKQYKALYIELKFQLALLAKALVLCRQHGTFPTLNFPLPR
jgi:hypothetical protein